MNKKTTSFLRLAVCMAFIMTLLVSMAAPSLAAPGMNQNNALVGDETQPADAAITKRLQVGSETTIPNLTFTFKIDKVSLDGVTIQEDPSLANIMPTIADRNIAFTSNDAHPLANNMSVRDTVNLIDNLHRESTSLFPSTGQNAPNWTRSGIYVYRVTEVQTVQGFTPSATEALTTSKAQYDLVVYVGERTTTGSGFYVWAIGAYNMRDDKGDNTGAVIGNPAYKVNPQPGGDPSDPINEKFSKLMFTNKYLRSGDGGATPSSTKFKVSKATKGLGSSSAKYFNFEVIVQKPSISAKTSYKVYVFEGTSTTPLSSTALQNNVQNATLITGNYIAFPIGTPVQIMLKHNQYLSFSDIDAGATYIVNELAAPNNMPQYTPSYELKKGTAMPVSQTGIQNGALSTPTTPPVTVTISPTNTWVDYVAFTNTVTTPPPTGIAVDDMPYFAIVAFAAIALGGYLFFRVRSRKNDEVAVEAN